MNHFTKYIISLLILLLIFIIIYDFFQTKEGFDVKDINKIVGEIKNVTNVVDDIPNEINNINKKLTEQVNTMGNEIEKNIMNTLTEKLGAVFIQIGNIFKEIFNILKEIANKIIILPNCIITYAIKEFINTFNLLYKKIIPNFLRNIFSFIYKYTFRYVFDFIGYITGYSDSVKKCYGFDISSQLNNINSSIKKIGSSF